MVDGLVGREDIMQELNSKIKKIKYLFTDCDGVLTDSGVYYNHDGEVMKRFSVRDGMGVERLRNIVNIETGIITGERSLSVMKRAEKLKIIELHLGIKDKLTHILKIVERLDLKLEEIAYIGDDLNDYEVMAASGLSACPADAMYEIKSIADYICKNKGGEGAFREYADLIIKHKYQEKMFKNQINEKYEEHS